MLIAAAGGLWRGAAAVGLPPGVRPGERGVDERLEKGALGSGLCLCPYVGRPTSLDTVVATLYDRRDPNPQTPLALGSRNGLPANCGLSAFGRHTTCWLVAATDQRPAGRGERLTRTRPVRLKLPSAKQATEPRVGLPLVTERG